MAAGDKRAPAPIGEDSLPHVAYRKSGKTYDPSADVWDWVDGPFRLLIDFNDLPENFRQFKTSLKCALSVFVKGYSPSYVKNLFEAFVHFARANPALAAEGAVLSPLEIGRYGATLAGHQTWRIGGLNPLLQKWKSLGLYGVDQSCVDYLRGRRKPGNRKGAAVRTRDPDTGPFTDSEFQAIFRIVTAAYEDGEVPLWVVVLVRLLAACGGRPAQLASLKISDFTPANLSAEKQAPAKISLPQIKNGLGHVRAEFLEFDLSARTAALLADYITELVEQFGCTPNSALFPISVLRIDGQEDEQRPSDDLYFDHPTGASLAYFFSSRIQHLSPTSERTGFAPISLNPRRFRYTFGTRLAEEGASKAVLADRLGHTDLQNVDVYFEASPEIVDNIERAMGTSLAPIAQAFRGRLIDREDQATHRGVPGSRIIDFRISVAPLGNCGKGCECGLAKPIACYTCHRFEPWLDGPHEESLNRLLKERGGCADERMAGVNDDAIAAIREVIAECAEARQQRQGRQAV